MHDAPERTPSAPDDPVLLDIVDGVATITLNRPEQLNAYTDRMGRRLYECLEAASADERARVVVIRGAGRAFCAGPDRDELAVHRLPDGTADVATELREREHPIVAAIRRLPKPVVAAVKGPVVGFGTAIALCCDLVVAHESAFFMLAFVNVARSLEGGLSAVLPTNAGLIQGAEPLMLGRRLTAQEALEWGLLNRVFADEDWEAGVRDFLVPLAAGPTLALANIKAELNAWCFPDFDDQLALEARLLQEQIAPSGDFAEGRAALVERRPGNFEGR